MALVAGIDSSTQSCKVVVRDADTGALVREGRAPHPDGTEVHPAAWWQALGQAVTAAGGLDDVAALAVGAQQHGMVLRDADGEVVRPALLWNDTRSAGDATDLVKELGAQAWAESVGSVPVASFTVTKLRWVAEHEAENAARAASVCLPHDWLTWRLAGGAGTGARTVTDRGDASGTGYWSPESGSYREDLLSLAFGRALELPSVLGPDAVAGEVAPGLPVDVRPGAVLAPGSGDNMSAALGVGASVGDVVVSIGTSGTVFATTTVPTADASGFVAGFADAAGGFLPLVCTLNAAQVLDVVRGLLRTDHAEFDRLALAAPPGSDGLVLLPYLVGERTPNRPDATGTLAGLRLTNLTPAGLARAAVEGVLCGLADGLDALVRAGVEVSRVLLVGGGARSEAVRRLAPALLGHPVVVPAPGEYVADGAAVQAAWALTGDRPGWAEASGATYEADDAARAAAVRTREAYAAVRDA